MQQQHNGKRICKHSMYYDNNNSNNNNSKCEIIFEFYETSAKSNERALVAVAA